MHVCVPVRPLPVLSCKLKSHLPVSNCPLSHWIRKKELNGFIDYPMFCYTFRYYVVFRLISSFYHTRLNWI